MSSELLSFGWLQQLLVVLLKLTLSFAEPTNGTECTARGPASYILVFTGHWSPQTFPKQYPRFRPPAQWSKLMGKMSHQLSPKSGPSHYQTLHDTPLMIRIQTQRILLIVVSRTYNGLLSLPFPLMTPLFGEWKGHSSLFTHKALSRQGSQGEKGEGARLF